MAAIGVPQRDFLCPLAVGQAAAQQAVGRSASTALGPASPAVWSRASPGRLNPASAGEGASQLWAWDPRGPEATKLTQGCPCPR